MVQDQTCQINGKTEAKRNTDILPSSLQNPSDPDATYRKKAGEKHVGFVGNFVETFDEDAAVITDFDYQQNTHSDSEFCKEVIENMEHQEEKTTLIADGAYASTENTQLADENNIELVTTALTGKLPNVIQADFVIDDDAKTVTACPAGHKPFQCKYNEVTESYRMLFNKQPCENCPHNQTCGVRFQKKTAVVTISKKTVQRAKYLRKMDSESYQQLFNKRNGVEGIPSVLRRKYGVDHIPVRGYVRSKMWFTLKIGAINVVRLLARVALEGFTVIFHPMQLVFLYFGRCHKLVQKVVAV